MHDLRQEDGLLAAVQQGRAALFLGAGASRGALSSQTGVAIPEAADLAREIARKFLGSDYEQYDLKAVCDLVASDRGIPTVQEYIHTRLDPFQPADSHRLLPTFVWGGLLTTNYDLMIERAYAECPNSLQNLVVFSQDDEQSLDSSTPNTLLYIKLHGCISRYQDDDPPLIASTEQIIRYKIGRFGLFNTFLEWAKTKTLIFAGYSFLDSNLRVLKHREILED